MMRLTAKMKTKLYLLSLAEFRKKYPALSKRQTELLAGDYAVKTVISNLMQIPYENVEIRRMGKPYVVDCPYQFNLSHSGDYLLLAVGDAPLGVDIEKITKIRPKTLEKHFTDEEQARVAKEGKTAFFEIWTQKESYVKYTGEGIKGLSKIRTYPEEIAFFTKQYEAYQIAVCTRKECLPKEIEMLP